MATYFNTIPQITWGAGFANLVSFGEPLDTPLSYGVPREGSEWAQGSSGDRDAWITGEDHRLRALVHRIPGTNTVTPPATGWDGATGWREFLAWARGMNAFRFYPNKDDAGTFLTCYLIAPLREPPTQEDDGTRSIEIELESTDGSAFTGY